jgi:diaminopimelate epimerase
LTDQTQISVESGAGIKKLQLTVENNEVSLVRVDMGEPILNPELIPVQSKKSPVVNEPIVVDGHEWRMTCVSMGNPHAVVFADHVADLAIEKYGPKFEFHERFPHRTNTEFVQLITRKEVSMRVWERGSGETWACGTGACAAVMACILNDYTDHCVQIHLRGGDLIIEYDPDTNHIFMTGPATEVFSGEWNE